LAGVDNAWEQEKLEARKMIVNAARREAAVPPASPWRHQVRAMLARFLRYYIHTQPHGISSHNEIRRMIRESVDHSTASAHVVY